MSRSSSIDEECPITVWRRAELHDENEIQKIIKYPQTEDLFGDRNIKEIIEKSNLCLCQENSVGRIVSFIALCDHPNIPALSPTEWLDWAKTLYGLVRVTVRNTFFIHYLAWSLNYSNEFLNLLLQTIFINNYYIQHILLVVPPGAATADILEEYFTRLLPLRLKGSHNVQTLLICMRQHHVPRLRIRKALEEDNDDVIPILETQNDDLRKLYGDFYIAEMISNPDNDRQMVVAEHMYRAIGFMSMNTNIDFQMLNYHFEMAPFYGLRKPNENDDVCSPSMVPGDSVEGLLLPSVIQSGEELTRLSVLSSVLEQDLITQTISAILPVDLNRTSSEEDSMESILIDESMTLFPSDEDFSAIGSILEEEEEDIIEGKQITIERNEPYFKLRSLDFPTYCGEPNAFMIELFAMHQDWDEKMSPDFLEAAFECYPDLDYCIMTLPPTCNTFPLLEHFVRVVPRPAQSFSHELYVCHRNSFLSEITVRYAQPSDVPLAKEVIGFIKNNEEMNIDFKAAVTFEHCTLRAFVTLSGKDIVGVAIVMPQEEMLYLHTHYDIKAFADLKLHNTDCHGILKHFTVSPIFNCHIRFFLSEILRLSEYTSLYYLHHHITTEQYKIPDTNIVTSLNFMIPIKPRHQIHYEFETLKKNTPCHSVLRNENAFALYYMNTRYTSLPKLHINTRIVVIGASHTALSFLETLLFGPTSAYLTFNNITLISPHGLPGEYETNNTSKKLFVHDGYYEDHHMAMLNFRTYINIIYGKMTGINRKEKHIVINHTSLIQYDYLMLFSGELFHLPLHYTTQDDSGRCVHGRRKSIDEPIKDIPQNVFLINTEIDAANSMIALKYFINRSNHPPIIVYGNCLEAYCCVAALQEFGVKSSRICFVEPVGRDIPNITCFNDKEVDDAVIASIKTANINLLSGFFFTDWKFNKASQVITKVKFESKTKSVSVECAAMFFYGNKSINKTTFLALEQGLLVYDGRLVINPNFQTSDKCIYAAGSFTKYARRYYGGRYLHRYYNSREIGEKVGQQMLKIWDPTEEYEEQLAEVPPLFVQPIIKSCILPGKRYYLKISKPGIPVPLEAAMSQDSYGIALVTGDCKPDSQLNYFRIHFNAFNMVETITCYSKENIDVSAYIAIYGLHERMLNNLLIRFETGYITDFYEYFKQPWCYAILHDRFKDFVKNLDKVFIQKEGTSFSPLTESIRLYLLRTNWKKMPLNKLDEFKTIYRTDHEQKIQDILIKFLSDNSYHLTMYAYPEVVKRILHGYENSLMFQKPDDTSSDDSDFELSEQ